VVVLPYCPKCGKEIEATSTTGQNICPSCGVVEPVTQVQSKPSEDKYCQYCGKELPIGASFCLNCGIPIKPEMLIELQKKTRFQQERAKSYLPSWTRERLDPNEFVHFSFRMKGDEFYDLAGKRFVKGDVFYLVTDKRIVKNKGGKYEEHPLSEVVSIGDLQNRRVDSGLFDISVIDFFEVITFQGSMVFEFDMKDAGSCVDFHTAARKALENHTFRKKDPRLVILQLPLTTQATTTTSTHPSASDKKYCAYCGSEMAHEGMFCINCGKKQP